MTRQTKADIQRLLDEAHKEIVKRESRIYQLENDKALFVLNHHDIVSQLQDKIDTLETANKNYEARNTDLSNELDALKLTIKDHEYYKSRVELLRHGNDKLVDRIRELESDLEDCKNLYYAEINMTVVQRMKRLFKDIHEGFVKEL